MSNYPDDIYQYCDDPRSPFFDDAIEIKYFVKQITSEGTRMMDNKELISKLNDDGKRYLYSMAHDHMQYRRAFYQDNLTIDQAITSVRKNMRLLIPEA